MGLGMVLFYGVMGSSILWVLSCGYWVEVFLWGLSVGWGLRYRLLWFGSLGGLGGGA